MFLGKLIILGVTGDVLIHRSIDIARYLVEQQADVHVLMTKEATKFINPLMFEVITNNKCLVSIRDEDYGFENDSSILSRSADMVLVAPASANAISRLSRGMADDMLTRTVLSCNCVKLVVPTLSKAVYRNPIVQDNIDILRAYGFDVIAPEIGKILDGEIDYKSVMAGEEEIRDHVERCISCKKDLIGKKVLVTAGATYERIDGLKYITSMSTGKTGYEIAKACMLRGADVTLVSGKTELSEPSFVKMVSIESAKDMYMALNRYMDNQDIIIKASREVDYAPSRTNLQQSYFDEEIVNVELRRNPDVMKFMEERKGCNQFMCVMSQDTQNVFEKARENVNKKGVDMMVVNNLRSVGTKLTSDNNISTIITRDAEVTLDKMTNRELAHKIIDQIILQMSL